MQDRYAGDVGDFQTFALLRVIAGPATGLRLGVCWYQPATSPTTATAAESGALPESTVTFDERLAPGMRDIERRAWHGRAPNALRPAGLVFLAPDNGGSRSESLRACHRWGPWSCDGVLAGSSR